MEYSGIHNYKRKMVKIEAMFRYRSQVKYQYCIVHKNVCREVSEIRGRKRERARKKKRKDRVNRNRGVRRDPDRVYGGTLLIMKHSRKILSFSIFNKNVDHK